MACAILIKQPQPIGSGGVLVSLTVTGEATDCSAPDPKDPQKILPGTISVTISCVGGGIPITKSAQIIFDKFWFVAFTQTDNILSASCSCGDVLTVTAKCIPGGVPEGVPAPPLCQTVETFTLNCAEVCTVDLFEDVDPCSNPPNGHVKYKAIICSPFPGDINAALKVDGVLGPSQQTPFSCLELNYDGLMSPGDHTFQVVIMLPPQCVGGAQYVDHVTVDPCPPDIPIGACCFTPPGAIAKICEEMTEAECDAKGGDYQSDGTKCDEVDCGKPSNGNGNGGGPCGAFTYVVAALIGLTLSAALLIATLYCLGVPVPPIIWGIVLGIAIATAVVIALWYALCAFGICPCPTGCDWLEIAWMATLASAIVALFLSGCCPVELAVSIGLFTVTAVTSGAWITACKPDACAVLAGFLVAVSTAAAVAISYITLLPVIAACGLTPVLVATITLGGALAVALATCKAANP